MKFLLDNNLSPRLARGLHELSQVESAIAVVHLRERFAPDTPDIDWIRELGAEGGWYVITHDRAILKNPLERQAWQQSGLIGVMLVRKLARERYWVKAGRLVMVWEDILARLKAAKPGTIFTLHERGGLNAA